MYEAMSSAERSEDTKTISIPSASWWISFVSIIPFVLFYDKIVIYLFVPHRSPSAWEWIACKEDTSGRRSSRGPGPGTVHSITSLWTNQSSFLEMWIQSLLSSVLSALALSPSPLVHHHHRPTLPSRAASAGWLLPSAFISFTPLSESISKDSEKGKVERNSFQIKTSSTDEEYQLRTGAVLTLSRIASISMTTNPINSSTSSWLLSGSFILSLT